ncbi:MAG: NAD(P)-dependent oxidoreductase, partial [Elusimicrobiota bacterium]|nr:NAD(P)-dependent oxidoreductase [Elusimicrobiota bacterium]
MNVLITGANGFIGSSLTEFLLSKDCNVRCLLRPSSRLNWLESIKSDKLSFFRAQGDDVPSLVKALENIDIVICCAGALRANSPQQYYDVNVGNTKKMCEAVLKAGGVKRFIFISSQAAAGPAGGLIPKTLADKANPISDYGKSKLLAEQAVKEMLDKKVDWTILRPSSVYGPRDKDIFIFFNLVSKHLRPKPLKPKFFQLIYA